MPTITVYIGESTYDKLRQLAEKTKKTIQYHVREACDNYIAPKKAVPS